MEAQSKTRKSPSLELLDFIYVPSSLLRLTHRKVKEGAWGQPIEKYKDSRFAKEFGRVAPYVMASMWEGARLYGYYQLGEAIAKNFL
jgi:hypothetical protein